MMKGLLLVLMLLTGYLQAQISQYPDRIFADSAYYPFYYGVASGDPLQDRVIIWTKVYEADSLKSIPLSWQMAADSLFSNIVNSGQVVCNAVHDFTAKVDVDRLAAGHRYYYRFITPAGKTSQTGIAQTLPDDTTRHFKLAIVSCSSVWSGYFNAYRRIAERPDIDFVIHLGDYVYDFVDKDEEVRVPVPYPTSPVTLKEWRERHTYYLLDPDLRAARQNKTWIAEWDNHESYRHGTAGGTRPSDAITAFYEYLPVRMPDTAHPENIYRTFHFGQLADLNMIDMYLHRGRDFYAPNEKSIMGNAQDAWLKQQLISSKATWKLIGNQEMMGSWLSEGLPKFIHVPGNGKYFDPSGWDEYDHDRNRLYRFIDSNHINNFVVMSGDLHMSFIDDLTSEPKNRSVYNARTGKGAVGVEVLGPSISRGNMDERHIPKAFIPVIQAVSRDINPHHRWCQFTKHGYVTLDVRPEHCVAEFWYSPILYPATKESFGRGFVVKNGVSHWQRKQVRSRKKSTYPLK